MATRQKGLLQFALARIAAPIDEEISYEGAYSRVGADGLRFVMHDVCSGEPPEQEVVKWDWKGRGSMKERFAQFMESRGRGSEADNFIVVGSGPESTVALAYPRKWVMNQVEGT